MRQPNRLVILVCLCCACGGVPSRASSLFENDVDGWAVSGNGETVTASLFASGGNPGGNLCSKDGKDGDTWYFVAPAKYLGDASASYGKRITWDLKQTWTYNQIRGRDLVLNGGGLALNFNIRFAPGKEWTPYSTRLDAASGWFVEDGTVAGAPATEEDVRAVLRNLTAVRFRGEFYDGPNDTACLDNVYFGTP